MSLYFEGTRTHTHIYIYIYSVCVIHSSFKMSQTTSTLDLDLELEYLHPAVNLFQPEVGSHSSYDIPPLSGVESTGIEYGNNSLASRVIEPYSHTSRCDYCSQQLEGVPPVCAMLRGNPYVEMAYRYDEGTHQEATWSSGRSVQNGDLTIVDKSQGSTVKKRKRAGRPPGSRNKKTLLRLAGEAKSRQN